VIIDFKDNALGNLESLSITDNGYGRNKPKLKIIYLIKAQHRPAEAFFREWNTILLSVLVRYLVPNNPIHFGATAETVKGFLE